jgi:hypothetical protein
MREFSRCNRNRSAKLDLPLPVGPTRKLIGSICAVSNFSSSGCAGERAAHT